MKSKFYFLESNYSELYQTAHLSEVLYYVDPSSSISKSRLFCEKLVKLIAHFEGEDLFGKSQFESIQYLHQNDILPEIVKNILHRVRLAGNNASHEGAGHQDDAFEVLRNVYTLSRWFYEIYENDYISDSTYELAPQAEVQDVKDLTSKVEKLSVQIQQYEQKIKALNASKDTISSRRKKAQTSANKIDLSEYETRIQIIDEQLQQAGWECDTSTINYKTHKSLPEKGKNKAIAEWPCGSKYADYALFVGLELIGVVEAKKYGTDISTDLRQSKVYAEHIDVKGDGILLGKWNDYKVPFLFSTNGRKYIEQLKTKSGIWFLDIRKNTNHAYPLKGWYAPQSLKEWFDRNIDEANNKLLNSETDYLLSPSGLNLREYQIEAIKSVEEKIIHQPEDRRALMVMATGTGKTRTINGLIYRLIKANRFKRILFLTDRTLLATQARDSIKDNKVEAQQSFSGIYQFEDLKSKFPDADTRLQFATVQSMVKRIFFSEEPFTVDTYDCIIVDEAHRGYQLDKEMNEDDFGIKNEEDYEAQYRKVLDYFDAYKIGMTATPALHTKEIFGDSVFNYSYRQAVIDGYLVDHEPPYNIETKLNTEGIVWEKGEKPKAYNPESGDIEELEALEDELKFEVEHFNKQVLNDNFNRVVIKELVQHLDPESQAKTLIFAARDSHADTIKQMLIEEFRNIGVEVHHNAIEKITGSVYDNAQLTRDFKNERYPNIVVTVDLLTTGIDVPNICNLVFMRRIRSRILFEQMLGRATRLAPEIGKEYFRIYDAVRLYEALEDYTQMQTVSNPSYTFSQLVEEAEKIENEERLQKQVEQIVAKLRRKSKNLQSERLEHFMMYSDGLDVSGLIEKLKNTAPNEILSSLQELDKLWNFLDHSVYSRKPQIFSDHDDVLKDVTRGYGKAQKPEDYIEGFKKFVDENANKIAAINIIRTKPEELDRKSLKELKLLLDEAGYNETSLNTAWKSTKNEDIAADIIAYIRTLSLGTDLVSPEQRIKNAIAKMKQKKQWNAVQTRWIDRFEKQLLAESVLTKQDLDLKPFIDEGGFNRLDKIFNHDLSNLITELNYNLYTA